jgi:hypothetical protein
MKIWSWFQAVTLLVAHVNILQSQPN